MPNINESANRHGAGRFRVGWMVALLASTALVAVPSALSPLGTGGAALAGGGVGGTSSFNGGGTAGATNSTGAGSPGGNGTTYSGGGGGGGVGANGGAGGAPSNSNGNNAGSCSGGSSGGGSVSSGGGGSGGAGATGTGSAGGDGGDGPSTGGGGGGGGGANGYVGTSAPTGAVAGGAGGNGGAGVANGTNYGAGGGGGAGGYGAVFTGSGSYTIQYDIIGGAGGKGGSGSSKTSDNNPGHGGDGGYGLLLTQSGAAITVNDGVTVMGGKGGAADRHSGNVDNSGAGALGISGTSFTLTLAPTATVAGGSGLGGIAHAIHFDGGNSTLELKGNGLTKVNSYATIGGLVIAFGTSNTFKISGLGGYFDLTKVDGDKNSTLATFGGFDKIEVAPDASSTWIVDGAQGTFGTGNWKVTQGTLQLGSWLDSATLNGGVDVLAGSTLAVFAAKTSTVSGAMSI
ncbi:hypothetical protein KHHGKMAE_1793 [Methylobacterium persicinum]|nr:hypothetical protein KHHGKMAE_1793 [Methylobacterium persicinum]